MCGVCGVWVGCVWSVGGMCVDCVELWVWMCVEYVWSVSVRRVGVCVEWEECVECECACVVR